MVPPRPTSAGRYRLSRTITRGTKASGMALALAWVATSASYSACWANAISGKCSAAMVARHARDNECFIGKMASGRLDTAVERFAPRLLQSAGTDVAKTRPRLSPTFHSGRFTKNYGLACFDPRGNREIR